MAEANVISGLKGMLGGLGEGIVFVLRGKLLGERRPLKCLLICFLIVFFLSNIGSIDKPVCYCSVFTLKFC